MKLPPFPGELTMQMVDHPFITKTGRQGCQRSLSLVLTDDQQAWLCRWFPEEENSRLMEASGLTGSALHRFARKFGLTKSPAGMKRIKKRQAAHIKRVCEKNGYYDSLRGKQLSEACQQGTARMWQEIRDGKREHPCRIMRRKNPRKYRKWMERKSDERKEAIRKETLRVIYGLERKTRLRCIVMRPYTSRQISHRYNALKRGYIVMEDSSEHGGERYNIYYDRQTQRAQLFERNLLADGFTLLPWQVNN